MATDKKSTGQKPATSKHEKTVRKPHKKSVSKASGESNMAADLKNHEHSGNLPEH